MCPFPGSVQLPEIELPEHKKFDMRNLSFPPGRSEKRTLPTEISSHSTGSVSEEQKVYIKHLEQHYMQRLAHNVIFSDQRKFLSLLHVTFLFGG